jgi:hypothetical protein
VDGRALFLASLLLLSTACAGQRFVIPTDTPTPRPDGAAIWDAATSACRDVAALGGQLRGSGRVAGNRVPGLRLDFALERPAAIALEARVSGTLFFSVRGTGADATLLLYQEGRAVTGPAAELLDALVGVSLDPVRLLAILSGCPATGSVRGVEALGAVLRARTDDAEVYLTDKGGPWRVRAAVFDDLIVDYQHDASGWPSRVRLATKPGQTPTVELTLVVEAADQAPRPRAVFVARIPEGFERDTIQWVREHGPLSQLRR